MQYGVKRMITAANTVRVTVTLPAEKFDYVDVTGMSTKQKEKALAKAEGALKKALKAELLTFLNPAPPKVVTPKTPEKSEKDEDKKPEEPKKPE